MKQEWTPINREFLKCLVSNIFTGVKRDVRDDVYGYFEDYDYEKLVEFVDTIEKAAEAEIGDFCFKNSLS